MRTAATRRRGLRLLRFAPRPTARRIDDPRMDALGARFAQLSPSEQVIALQMCGWMLDELERAGARMHGVRG